jgi:hypothetical protein
VLIDDGAGRVSRFRPVPGSCVLIADGVVVEWRGFALLGSLSR